MFIHLHTHSHYTFQQALGTPEDIVNRAKELGQTAIALTDRGNLHGAFDFYVKAIKEGIKPIIGIEFMISRKGRANRERDNDLYEIVLLAKDFAGYQNLIMLTTIAQKE
jgi:DNA polymerase-3 subunit alpha